MRVELIIVDKASIIKIPSQEIDNKYPKLLQRDPYSNSKFIVANYRISLDFGQIDY